MNIIEKLTRFVSRVFKTNLEVFLEALKRSPNAQGYVNGSVTELLLKQKLETEYKLELHRIREKWEGKKSHHGDFYFRKQGSEHWYVLESKGVKSNSEKWHKLYNYENLKRFLFDHADKIPWIDQSKNIEEQVASWIDLNFPKFKADYAATLYEYDEVQKYAPRRETSKASAIAALRGLTRDEINGKIGERIAYVRSKIEVLETHLVSGTSKKSERTQATPRKDEFNVLSLDICLRYPEHKFLFCNPQNLESSGDDANHLQQNYIVGFVFTDAQGKKTITFTEEWFEDFEEVYCTLDPADCALAEQMQRDNRYIEGDETGLLDGGLANE